MAKKIYSILLLVSFGLGYYLYSVRESHSNVFLIVTSGVVFTLLSMGIHGLVAHSLNPNVKGGIILYPILMGVLWAFLFFLFVFFVLPLFCPDFMLKL
ncbi:hypothetical protein HZY62_04075 [Maribacter polysiphoniae]|uniref:Uncharacterized protein n=1 Tax=Maribacter polysiphoniae TaxID=429344 RepID=A0A316DYV5_9FLAO|nr:hypothetical protein [Maribacter polysiphoniae]MBD1259753.1 hypothetical protein [Maribacter polysiphoniae]PWK23105.1 hypothetical protein LX92_02434 [Maribacter polysiphoniae]